MGILPRTPGTWTRQGQNIRLSVLGGLQWLPQKHAILIFLPIFAHENVGGLVPIEQ